ncbi:hypothetical protein [Flavobacterium chungbukense]|uniref:Uncharacterized protein n=1 Tax=Flavobacterium chungbukense TaxID=877464 RepID=A0ABP7YHX6_9FLAO|nr:hypothetical protein [Flavobacterium chungbukense]MCC4920249.1 hypothetical protein [Flavobacterium chungbukense]
MTEKIKECFIIMPISNNDKYSDGHFKRVYQHLIVPACEIAGFKPVRADDIINTNYIAIDIIKRIIESDMAICDLSSQNPNVLYELGIRQAFNKPVTLIKDKSTKRIFDIQGFRDFEYDENLRIDNVESEVENLAELIQNTYKSQGNEINSLVSLLSLSPAKLKENNKSLSIDTELILNTLLVLEKKISNLENRNGNIKSGELVASPQHYYGGGEIKEIEKLPDGVGDRLTRTDINRLKIGDKIYQPRFGIGEILNIEESGTAILRRKADVKFDVGIKRLALELASLRKVE